jgi:hypothetical protein
MGDGGRGVGGSLSYALELRSTFRIALAALPLRIRIVPHTNGA